MLTSHRSTVRSRFLATVPAAALGVALMAAPAQAGTLRIYDHKPAHAQTRTGVVELGCSDITTTARRTRSVSRLGNVWLAGSWRAWRLVSIDASTSC